MSVNAASHDLREVIRTVLAPGFFTETAADDALNRWKDGDKVRFKNGQPEKFGGWEEEALSGATHYGIPRRTHEWTSLDGENWIAEATNSKLYVINRGVRYDITPVRRASSTDNPFTTTNLDSVVLVTDPAHSSEVGDFVRYSGATAVAGLTIDGEYQIIEVLDNDQYRIDAGSLANASTTGGGAVAIEYDLNVMPASQGLAVGWGVCAWGEGTWGTARSEDCSDVIAELGLWSLDNFGEDLIASPRGGAVYWWDRTNGASSRAIILPNAPATNQRVLVSNTGAQIICLGAFDYVSGSPDPMLIRVGAEESLNDFIPSDDNTAFDERLATGSRIVSGIRTRGGVIVTTDQAAYIMRADPTEVFTVEKLGDNSGALCPNGMLEAKGIGYWIGANKFFMFDGVLTEIPCEVWQRVFAERVGTAVNPYRIDMTQKDKIYSWFNDKFSEITWLYTSVGGSGENDCYVVYNTDSRVWYHGTLERTAGNQSGATFGVNVPFAFGSDGKLYRHEVGEDADGAPMDAFIETHDFTISAEAKNELTISQAVPDMVRHAGNLLLYLKSKKQPSAAGYVIKGPYTITTTTERKGVRITGRQVAVQFRSNELGASWRLGPWRFFAQPDAEN